MIEALKNIKESNVQVKEILAISKCEYKPFKQKPGYFLTCDLSDKTGTIKGIVWEGAEALKEWIRDRMVIEVTGELTRYNDVPQIVIKTMKKKDDFNPADFIQSLESGKINSLVEYLVKTKETIKDPICQWLWNYVLFDPYMSKKYMECPGGVGDVHHNYLGGLLEHSSSMIKMADDFSKEQPSLNRDLLLTGALIHDIGKTDAYRWNIIIEMTDRGRLLHHINTGLEILCKQELTETGLYDGLHSGIITENQMFLKLKHIIASHHQDAESSVKPMIPEAVTVAFLDALDASTNHCIRWISEPEKQKEDENWTTYCQLTGRFYYNPKEEKKDIPISEENTFSPKKKMDSIY